MMHASFLGLSLPWLLFPAIAALVLSRLGRHLLALAGVYRWIWHPPLFDLALDVLTFCASVRVIQLFTQ